MRTVCAILLVAASLAAAAPAARAADVAHGKKLAERYCARCHVVGDFNPMGGIGSTASLQWIKKLDDWRDRFHTFYARRPHAAFLHLKGVSEPRSTDQAYANRIELSEQDAKDIFAFVETLKVPGN